MTSSASFRPEFAGGAESPIIDAQKNAEAARTKLALDGLIPCPGGYVVRIKPGQSISDVCGQNSYTPPPLKLQV